MLQAITDDETSLSDMQYLAADVDGDGTLDANDAIYLLYHVMFGDGDYPLN